jgi:hypothetical protein
MDAAHVRLPGVEVVLSQAAPATLLLDEPERAEFSKFPVAGAGTPELPGLEVAATSQSFGSPVVRVIPGDVLDPVAVLVIPIAATPEYSSEVRLYCVDCVKLGVTEVKDAQFRQIRMAEHESAPHTWA